MTVAQQPPVDRTSKARSQQPREQDWHARRSGDTNPKTWQKFVRRAEAVYDDKEDSRRAERSGMDQRSSART